MRQLLAAHLEKGLALPPDAVLWLLAVWDVFQGLDDWVDGTPVERSEQDREIWQVTVGMSANPFFVQYAGWLQPVVANAVLKWQAADFVERGGEREQLPKAYMWRAGYYDIVLQAVLMAHGNEAAVGLAPEVMRMYGETLDGYLKEMHGA